METDPELFALHHLHQRNIYIFIPEGMVDLTSNDPLSISETSQ